MDWKNSAACFEPGPDSLHQAKGCLDSMWMVDSKKLVGKTASRYSRWVRLLQRANTDRTVQNEEVRQCLGLMLPFG